MARRRTFNPDRVSVPADERPNQAGADTVSPSGLNVLIRDALASRLPRTLRVLGEIGEWTQAGSGHLYFSLSDSDSEIRCVMWRSDAARLTFEPESGLEVIATGSIDVYLPRGSYQLMVRKLEPRGIGALEIAFRQLQQKLASEGFFDRERKRELPVLPKRIGVVTSPTGAAIRDIQHTLKRRFPAAEVLLFPCRVQGDGAAAEIATAIKRMNQAAQQLGGIDVAIVGRGGGSLEDLWAFNEEPVARAIFASKIPIVSAVGHEVDTTISDLVADVRAATPTAAAELVVPLQGELLEAVQIQSQRAGNALRQSFALASSEFARLLTSQPLAYPQRQLEQHAQQLDEQIASLRAASDRQLANARRDTNELEIRLLRVGSQVGLDRGQARVEQKLRRIKQALDQRVRRSERVIQQQLWQLDRQSPERHLSVSEQRISSAVARLALGLDRQLKHRDTQLEAKIEILRAVDPKRILQRGYAIVRLAKSKAILRSVQDVREGKRLSITISDGEFRVTADDPRQPTLFDE